MDLADTEVGNNTVDYPRALYRLFLSWVYTAPPLRPKKVGLGELDVLIAWGRPPC